MFSLEVNDKAVEMDVNVMAWGGRRARALSTAFSAPDFGTWNCPRRGLQILSPSGSEDTTISEKETGSPQLCPPLHWPTPPPPRVARQLRRRPQGLPLLLCPQPPTVPR